MLMYNFAKKYVGGGHLAPSVLRSKFLCSNLKINFYFLFPVKELGFI